jgi:hypothetical protein
MDLKKYIPFILIRLLSLELLLEGFAVLPSTFSMLTFSKEDSVFLQLPQVLLVIFSIALWFLSNPLATYLSKGFKETDEPIAPINNYSLECIIISAIGLYVMVSAVPSLFGMISYNVSMNFLPSNVSKAEALVSILSRFFMHLTKFILGIVLIVFSKRITDLFRNFRLKGHEETI